MALFNLIAKLSLDGAQFQTGLKQAQSGAQAMGANIASSIKGQLAGAFGTAAIISYVREIIRYGREVHDMGRRLSMTTDKVQELNYAASQSGTSLEEIALAFKFIAKTRSEALEGKTDFVKSFAAFGVTIADLKSKNPEQLFMQIARAVQASGDATRLTSDAIHILGRSADKIMGSMRDGIADSAKEFEKLNMAIRPETIEKLEKMGDHFAALWLIIKKGGAEAFIGINDLIAGPMSKLLLIANAAKALLTPSENPEQQRAFAEDLLAQALIGGEGEDVFTERLEKILKEKRSARASAQSTPETETDEEKKKRLSERAKLQEQLTKLQFAELDNAGKLAELEARKLKFAQDYWDATRGSNAELRASIGLAETAREERQIMEQMRRGERAAAPGFTLTERQRSGAFSSMASGPEQIMVSEQRRTNMLLFEANRRQAAIEQNTRRSREIETFSAGF